MPGEGLQLPSYRVFKFDPESRRRAAGEWLEASDDDHALETARSLANGGSCEVWLQDRLVGIVARGR